MAPTVQSRAPSSDDSQRCMTKPIDVRENALTRLRALRAEKPVSQMGQIRWVWPEIKAALAVGHSLTTVHQRLREAGIEIPYRRLSLYIGRLRREQAASSGARTAPADMPATSGSGSPAERLPETPVTQKVPEQPSKRDPLANLRNYANTRPGFHWDEAPPDEDQLF